MIYIVPVYDLEKKKLLDAYNFDFVIPDFQHILVYISVTLES